MNKELLGKTMAELVMEFLLWENTQERVFKDSFEGFMRFLGKKYATK